MGILGNFLSCIRRIKDPFEAQEGMWAFSRDTQWRRPSSRVKGIISWFFSSCARKLGFPLLFQLGPQGPTRVAAGKSSLHVSCEWTLGTPLQSVRALHPHQELRPEPQDSSPVLTVFSVFLWSFNSGVRPRHGVETCKPTFLLSCNSSIRLPVELT